MSGKTFQNTFDNQFQQKIENPLLTINDKKQEFSSQTNNVKDGSLSQSF